MEGGGALERGIMEGELWRGHDGDWNHGGGTMERNHGEGTMEREPWRRNHGGGTVERGTIEERTKGSIFPPQCKRNKIKTGSFSLAVREDTKLKK